MRRLVITGGPFSGKTTLINALKKKGYPTLPEAAILEIESGIVREGLEAYTNWRIKNPTEFQLAIDERQIHIEKVCAHQGLVVMDRSRVDGVAYLRLSNKTIPDSIYECMSEQYGLQKVLVLDTLSKFDERSSTGRTSNRESSIRIRDQLIETYRQKKTDPILVPEASIDERLELIENIYSSLE